MKGAGGKAFCAGGDVVAIAESSKGSDGGELSRSFFREEYVLDYLLATLKKPYIAIIDGITMGGGVGLSVNSKFRIATEKTRFAMPETAIGLFPDVGGSYFLPRLQGELGMFLALTGTHLIGEDVLHAGIATHYVPSAKIPELEAGLQGVTSGSVADVKAYLDTFHNEASKPFSLADKQSDIDRLFAGSSLAQIFAHLQNTRTEWADKQLQVSVVVLLVFPLTCFPDPG